MGDWEASAPAGVESPLRYHPARDGALTQARDPGREQRQAGSLTGAVSSQSVTEEFEGTLGTVGHRANSAMA